MRLIAYLRRARRLRRSIQARSVDGLPDRVLRTANLATASLQRLLGPQAEDGERTLRDVYFNQACAALDEETPPLVRRARIRDAGGVLRRAAAGEPFIFCTYHLGSYRLITGILAYHGVRFALLLDHHTLETQGPTFRERFAGFTRALGREAELELLDAEAPNVAMQAVRRVRGGTSLLVYIDGNTGVGGVRRRDEKLLRVDFLDGKLFARKGVAFLSHALRAPVVPVATARTGWLSRTTVFHPALAPAEGEDRDAYCARTTQALFDRLAEQVRHDPGQWEGWLYVHRFLDTTAFGPAPPVPEVDAEALRPEESLRMDHQRWAVLRYPAGPMLFDRTAFRFYPLSSDTERMLRALSKPVRVADLRGTEGGAAWTLVPGLLDRGIVVSDRIHRV